MVRTMYARIVGDKISVLMHEKSAMFLTPLKVRMTPFQDKTRIGEIIKQGYDPAKLLVGKHPTKDLFMLFERVY